MSASQLVLEAFEGARQAARIEEEARVNTAHRDHGGSEIRTVVVATDGTQRSLRVVPHAEVFARRSGAYVRLVHIQQAGATTSALDTAEQTAAQSSLVYSRGRSEGLAEAILRAARDLKADLIAMHSEHAYSAVHHAISGSVMLDVLARTHVPLLVSGPSIRETAHDTSRFTVATDGSEESDRALLRQADWLLERSFEAMLLEVYLPRLGDEGERVEIHSTMERLNRLKQSLTRDEVSVAVEAVSAPRQVKSRIIEKSLEAEAFGIAMSTEAHRRLRHVVLGSMSMAILRKSPVPLLLTPR